MPEETIHYLIRRNGAALVDRVVDECGTDLRTAGFFFGQRLKCLRRDGVKVDPLTVEHWCELFGLFQQRPVLAEAWRSIMKAFAAEPDRGPEHAAASLGLDSDAGDWRRKVKENVARVRPDRESDDPLLPVRFHMGILMNKLRGRVPAAEVFATLEQELAGSAHHE